jgi:hypothetical protein
MASRHTSRPLATTSTVNGASFENANCVSKVEKLKRKFKIIVSYLKLILKELVEITKDIFSLSCSKV